MAAGQAECRAAATFFVVFRFSLLIFSYRTIPRLLGLSPALGCLWQETDQGSRDAGIFNSNAAPGLRGYFFLPTNNNNSQTTGAYCRYFIYLFTERVFRESGYLSRVPLSLLTVTIPLPVPCSTWRIASLKQRPSPPSSNRPK